MFNISVPDMHCIKCVERINKALSERAAKAAEVEYLKNQIIGLKAKLYDLITK